MASAFKKIKKLFPWRRGRLQRETDESFPGHEAIAAEGFRNDVFEIDRNDLKLTRKITEDRLVEIHEGVLISSLDSTETRVVAKITKTKSSDSEKRNIQAEAQIIKSLNSHHVEKLIGMITVQEPFCLVTEYMAFGDLKGYLRSHNPDFQEYVGRGSISSTQMLQMCGEIADGMAYISSRKLVHRDLSARNCLVGEDKTVKIGGFLMARQMIETVHGLQLMPIRWMAPEVIEYSNYSVKSDVWSYGVLLWEIATLGRQPYQGSSNEEVVKQILSGRTMDIPEPVPTKMYDLMNMCWKFKPSERPQFLDIIELLEPDLDEKFHKVSYFSSEERTVPDGFAHDPYALDLYRKALEEGKEEDRSIRINIVGNFGQGKTSLVRRLVGESNEGVQSTNGIDVDRYECKTEKDGTFSYVRKETIDDFEIGNRLVLVARTNIVPQRRRCCNTTGKSLDDERFDVAGFQKSLDETVTKPDKNNVQEKTFLVDRATSEEYESDFSDTDRQINRSEQNYLMEPEFKIFQDGLKGKNDPVNDTNVPFFFDIWDFGGQHTFYATHTIFHSSHAIYLLVFNLSLALQELVRGEDGSEDASLISRERDMAYYIRFWMNSIHSFVGNEQGIEPPVILVGTHKDKLPGNEQDKQMYADKYFCDVRDLFEDTQVVNHIQSEDFAVDNTVTSDDSVRQLREAIIRLGEERSRQVSVPAKWIQLEKLLSKNKTRKIISLEMVLKMDAENEFPIANIEQIKLFLRYHHNKGSLCYFDEEPISNDVVLDPQYLIDAFKCIITSGNFCKRDIEMREFWQKLLKEAKLDYTLIDRVWEREKDKKFSEHKSTLIAFLKKHHIISEAMKYDPTKRSSKGLGWYLVPSLLRHHSSENEISKFLHGKQQTVVRYVLTFDSSAIVPTIYHRVISATVGKWPVAQFQDVNLIYENLTALHLNGFHDGILEMNDHHIELSVVSLCPTVHVNAEIADGLRRFVESVVEHEFNKLKDTAGNLEKPFVTNLRCNHPDHGISGSLKLLQVYPKHDRQIVPCPDSMSHEIFIKKALSEWFQDIGILPNIPKRQLSEKCLSKISRAVGSNWELLGIELGLSDIEIQHISADNPSAVMRIYKMLITWNRKQAEKATMDVLVQAMRNIPEVSVDWDIIRNVIDEIKLFKESFPV